MLFPVAQTQPAKFVSAHLASHVVASLVLLDRLLTGRTSLGVGQDPGDVLTLIGVLQIPLGSLLAVARGVRLIRTLKAKPVATLAKDVRDPHILVLHTVVAALERTPSHVPVVVSVGLASPLLVGQEVFPSQHF